MKKVKLNNIAIFVLFITSYIPLLGLLILRQVKQNIEYLNFGGFSQESILLTNLDTKKSNGELVKIVEVENKNSESISYISTYIVL